MSLSNTNPAPTIDSASFREALGHFASGITIITTQVDEEPIGFTCQSFYSVSMNPPLVSFSVKASSFSYPKIRQAERFAVNILSSEQSHVSTQFAMRGADKWQGIDWQLSPLGNPVINDSLHWLDCKIHAEHPAGDHLIVIGEVKGLNLDVGATARPLLYFKGKYGGLAGEEE
ncbi:MULTISPECIES: flavin reductase family protein [Cobetia]|uniref:flavin reductase family protein n=1 Tax=Cobetia TaxID=204286 RepID=UPI00098464E9|nr:MULTISPECIES: flavin reductase family protein [Cobetia]POR08682.1 flavin reductase [Cobetia sp. MM1IDA2H-1]